MQKMTNNEFEDIIELNIEDQGVGERIDKFLSDMLSSYSRSRIQKLISDGLVLVNNKNIKSNHKLNSGDFLPQHRFCTLQSGGTNLRPAREGLFLRQSAQPSSAHRAIQKQSIHCQYHGCASMLPVCRQKADEKQCGSTVS